MLTLPLKREYFEAISRGEKTEEFRLCTAHWERRLSKMRLGELFVLTLGYPPAASHDRRIQRVWRGMERRIITHPHFGAEPVEVFAIDVRA